ncbi:hypothetical protein A1F99_122000 [Pyrenophora tritici-repentis]|nr:hypothetical protein A1F99_122000 [Pyrenophora tritici-repentis]
MSPRRSERNDTPAFTVQTTPEQSESESVIKFASERDDDTPKAAVPSRSLFGVVISPGSEPLPSPWLNSSARVDALQSASNVPKETDRQSLPSTFVLQPAPASMHRYLNTMQSELHRLSAPPSSSHRQTLRNRREVLFKEALKESIVSTKASIALRATIAEEVKASVEGLLTSQEKDPQHTIKTMRLRSKGYWSKIHQDIHRANLDVKTLGELQRLDQLYSTRDIERVLFFWAVYQEVLSYGDIAYELSLPLGILPSWIMRYVEHV